MFPVFRCSYYFLFVEILLSILFLRSSYNCLPQTSNRTISVRYIAVGDIVICLALYILGNTNELRNFALTTQQRRVLICSFEYGLLLVLQDSWCLGLLVLETKWLSGVLIKQRVLSDVWGIVFKVTVYFCVSGILGESMRYLDSYGPEVKRWLVCRERSYARIDIANFWGDVK